MVKNSLIPEVGTLMKSTWYPVEIRISIDDKDIVSKGASIILTQRKNIFNKHQANYKVTYLPAEKITLIDKVDDVNFNILYFTTNTFNDASHLVQMFLGHKPRIGENVLRKITSMDGTESKIKNIKAEDIKKKLTRNIIVVED